MAGLLDGMFGGTPGQQGLLAGSMALLNAGGPSRMPISIGQALARGMGAGQVGYNQALKNQQDAEEMAMQNELRQAQMQKMQADAAARERRDRLLQDLAGGAAGPDKVENVGMALLYDGDPRGQAVLAQAAKMKEAENKQAEFTGFKATDAPDRAGAAERFMGPELAQVPGVHQRAMALGNYVQQTPQGKGDAGYVRKELAALDKMVEDYNSKMLTQNAAAERAQTSADLRRDLASNRPERQPVIREIVDPDKPNQMISVDVNKWQNRAPGTRDGVVGIAGKTPASTMTEEKVVKGQEMASNAIATLRDAYNTLEKGGGIQSSEKGVLGNIKARSESTSLGQTMGQFAGSKNQKARDTIEQTRPVLMQALMQALGITSRQMDSNVELKLYLATATDPTKDIEANRAALDALEQRLGMSGDTPKTPASNTGAYKTATNPKTGEKMIFKDGKWQPM